MKETLGGHFFFGLFLITIMMGTIYLITSDSAFNPNRKYPQAIICFPDGKSKTVLVDRWFNHGGNKIKIEDVYGGAYIVDSDNCIIYSD